MFLIVVDSYFKWIEIIFLVSANSVSTINSLRNVFSMHGLPKVIVTDNGSQFTSSEFHDFMKRKEVSMFAPHCTIPQQMVWLNVRFKASKNT